MTAHQEFRPCRKRPIVVHARPAVAGETIDTLEGQLTAAPGDFIIRGVRGELYPCAGDIFRETYDWVDAPTTPNPLPTIGCIVHYYDSDLSVTRGEPLAAIVTGLPPPGPQRAEGMIKMVAFRTHTDNLHITPVMFSPTPRVGYWSWLPATDIAGLKGAVCR